VLLRPHLLSRKIAGSQVPAPQLDLLSKIADVSSTPLPNTYAKPRTRLRKTKKYKVENNERN
jgi:hypothetical protein